MVLLDFSFFIWAVIYVCDILEWRLIQTQQGKVMRSLSFLCDFAC